MTWKKSKIPTRSRRRTLAPTQVHYLEGVSWTGELPPVGPQFKDWLDQNTHSLKLAVKYGDQESIDELIEILKTPCIQPHHPENAELTASVCETVASKIRSVAPYSATDDISDRLNSESQNLESGLAIYWRENHPLTVNSKVAKAKILHGTLPDSTIVQGNLSIVYLPDTPKLLFPDGMHVIGDMIIYSYPFPSLPSGLNIDGDFIFYGGEVVSLPADLKIGGGLVLRRTKIERLPHDLVVKGTLDLTDCMNLESIPSSIKVDRIIIPNEHFYHGYELDTAIHDFNRWKEGWDVKP